MGLIKIGLITGLAVPLVAGYAVILLLLGKREESFLFKLALSYGLGLGVLTQWMLVLGMLKVPCGFDVVAAPLLASSSLLIFLQLKKRRPIGQGRSRRYLKAWQEEFFQSKVWEKVFVAAALIYIAYLIYYVFWRALNLPIYFWDAVSLTSLKAKVFYFERTLEHLKNLPHCSYPLHIALAQSWMALSLGAWDNQLIKLLFPLFFVSYLAIQYHFMKCFTNRTWALLGIILVISSKIFIDFATVALRDFPLMYYNCCAVMLLFLWNKRRDDAYLVLAALFSGFGTFTKLEGTGYLIIHSFIILFLLISQKEILLRDRTKKFFKFVLPSLGIYLLFVLYKILAGIPIAERTQFDFIWENLDRIPLIFIWFGKLLFLSGHWNILWFLLVLSLVNLTRKDVLIEGRRLLSVLLVYAGFYFILALCSEVNFVSIAGAESVDASPRIFLHFFPVAVWAIILLNYPRKVN